MIVLSREHVNYRNPLFPGGFEPMSKMTKQERIRQWRKAEETLLEIDDILPRHNKGFAKNLRPLLERLPWELEPLRADDHGLPQQPPLHNLR
jgi:hypothetical protein